MSEAARQLARDVLSLIPENRQDGDERAWRARRMLASMVGRAAPEAARELATLAEGFVDGWGDATPAAVARMRVLVQALAEDPPHDPCATGEHPRWICVRGGIGCRRVHDGVAPEQKSVRS